MKLLVLAPHAVDAGAVRDAVPGEDLSDAEVLVVSPALNPSGLRFWMSDADDAIAKAQETSRQVADELAGEAARTRATTGESEPLLALHDALATFPADRILIFKGDGEGYREEDLSEASDRFDVPVSVV